MKAISEAFPMRMVFSSWMMPHMKRDKNQAIKLVSKQAPKPDMKKVIATGTPTLKMGNKQSPRRDPGALLYFAGNVKVVPSGAV